MASFRSLLLLLLALSMLAGCNRKIAAPPPPPPPKVKFAVPIEQTVQEYAEFPGRTAPVEMVEVRSRVTGYLQEIAFEDGATVKAGDPLFVIDPRIYEAEESRTKAMIDQFQARVSRLDRQQERARELFDKQAISQDQYETILYDRTEATASLEAAVAAHRLAKLNVEFSRITSPLTGRVSRRLVDVGNLVTANETPLAMLVSLEDVHVYFDMDERTVLRLRRLTGNKPMSSTADLQVKVEIGLSDSDEFDLTGIVDFEDNQLDASTGTLRVRAVVKNTDGLLSPGLFVRVRYPVGESAPGLLIPEESLGSDQGRPFVYVIGEDNKVVYRAVEVGPQVGPNRVIRSGIKSGERVVVTGLQRIRRNTLVVPEPS